MFLRTLGSLTLEGTRFHRPKPLLLLTYLALEGPTERRYLSELFWMDAANARRSLTMALSQLRAGAPSAAKSDDTRIWTDIACDATQLLQAAEEQDWLRMVELYRGPFLEGFDEVGSGLEVEEWIYRTRELLAHSVCKALLALGWNAAVAGNYREAGTWASRAEAAATTAPLAPQDLGRLYVLLLAGDRGPHSGLREEASAFDLDLPDTVSAARELIRTAAHPSPAESLPSRTTSFIGRQHELNQLSRLVEDPTSRLMTVVGAGGTGKTRLALRFATEEAQSARWSGVHFVSLESLQHADEVTAVIADSLGVHTEEPKRAMNEIRHTIGSSRTLIVLDNFEHLLTAAPLLVQLIRGCENLRLVVTSRERLNLDEEYFLLLEGLSVPASESVSAEEALAHDAVSLFVQRARQARPDFTLEQAHVTAVVRICRLVGGMPLAIEMASAWLSVMSSAEIADEIATSLDVLESPNRDLPERHKSMRVVFEHSWQLSSPDEQRLMRALTVFRGGFTREAAASVAGAGLSRLRALVDRSLLSWNGVGRYELHPLLHQFLNEKAVHESDEAVEVAERHATYFLQRVAAQRSALPHQDANRAARDIETDLANILAGWEWAAGNEREDLLEDATNQLGWYFFFKGRPLQGIAWIDIAGHANSESLLAVRQLMWRASFLKDLGELQRAMQLLERAANTAERLGADADLAIVLRITGLAYVELDPPDRAGATSGFQRALDLYEQMGDVEGVTMMLNNLAFLEDDPIEARKLLERGLHLARQAGEMHSLAVTAGTLAELLMWSFGDYEAGLAIAAEGVACHEKTGFSVSLAITYVFMGAMLVLTGDLDQIETYAKRALGLTDSLQGGPSTAIRGNAFALLGHAERFRGDMDASAELFHQAIRQIEHGPSRTLTLSAMGFSLNGLARIALVRGRPDEARAHATRAIEYLSRHGAAGSFCASALRLSSLIHLGETFMLEGRHDEAEAHLQETLRLAIHAQQAPPILEVLFALGQLRHQQGQDRLAHSIAATVAGHPASPYEVAERARALHSQLPSLLGAGATEPTVRDLFAAAAITLETLSHHDRSALDTEP